MTSYKLILLITSIYGFLAIFLGAFGAHGLKSSISVENLENYKTGVSYIFYQLPLLFFIIINKNESLFPSAYLIILGLFLFSGSLFLLSTRELHIQNINKILWPITPIGGLLLLFGWGYFIYINLKN